MFPNKDLKKVYVKSYGCQMNVYDSDRMKDILAPLGYAPTETPEDADLVILNTCHIREKATEKVYSDLGRIRPHKIRRESQGSQQVIAVAGCTAQAEGAEIMSRAPYVDMVFGPQAYHKLPEMLARLAREKDTTEGPFKGVLETDFPVESKFDHLPEPKVTGPSAFVSIQEGCDKFCHFCVVPYTRGAEFSRPVAEVLKEVKGMVQRGAREVMLLGQNVNGYHGEAPSGRGTWTLGQLLEGLSEIQDLERLRYITSHPQDVEDTLIQAHRDLPKVMPYLHLPVQSGSDRILKAMNRRHTVAHYYELLEKFREARPDIAFTSDFIVGYPGEREDDFEKTLELVEKVRYAMAYSFCYSPRPGTPAALMDFQVPEETKKKRLARLQDVLKEHQMAFNTACIGKTLPVLFEKKGRHEGQFMGRSPYLQSVYAKGHPRLVGQIVSVKIHGATQNSLAGDIVFSEDVIPQCHHG